MIISWITGQWVKTCWSAVAGFMPVNGASLMDPLREMHIVHSYIGLFHTVTAVLAMIFGTAVFLNRKGTARHKVLGRIYAIFMLLLNLSAFAIYNFGGFSLFHGFALVSLGGLVLGMVPAMRRNKPNWFGRHFYFMNWSVVGLYCAFWSEVGVRFFDMRHFWWVVVAATMLTAITGAIFINKEAKKLKLA